MNKNKLWVGAYYPASVLSQPRTRTILCLLFDRIICNFPVTGMACGGGFGVTEFYNDSPLVEEEILELREELLLEEIETNFTEGYFWGRKEEFNKYIDLQVTKMALNLCESENAVPITDNINMTVPLALIEKNKMFRFAHLQAAALAIQSLEVALPNFSDISDYDILEARLKLKDQLIPFRRAMLMIAPIVRNGINSDATLSEVYNEAKYIVDTKIAPALDDLKDKLNKERGRFWSKLIMRGGFFIPKLALNWAAKGALATSIIGLDDIKCFAMDTLNHQEIIETIKNQGGIGFLLKIAEYPKFKELSDN